MVGIPQSKAYGKRSMHRDNKGALNVVAFTFLAVTFLERGFGVTDEEFQVGYMS